MRRAVFTRSACFSPAWRKEPQTSFAEQILDANMCVASPCCRCVRMFKLPRGMMENRKDLMTVKPTCKVSLGGFLLLQRLIDQLVNQVITSPGVPLSVASIFQWLTYIMVRVETASSGVGEEFGYNCKAWPSFPSWCSGFNILNCIFPQLICRTVSCKRRLLVFAFAAQQLAWSRTLWPRLVTGSSRESRKLCKRRIHMMGRRKGRRSKPDLHD